METVLRGSWSEHLRSNLASVSDSHAASGLRGTVLREDSSLQEASCSCLKGHKVITIITERAPTWSVLCVKSHEKQPIKEPKVITNNCNLATYFPNSMAGDPVSTRTLTAHVLSGSCSQHRAPSRTSEPPSHSWLGFLLFLSPCLSAYYFLLQDPV